ncbi:UDP-N-acetylmuramate dehydrogenase [Bacteroidota bacterium]
MIRIHENFSLKKFNTFGIEANSRYFIEFDTKHDIEDIIQGKEFEENNTLILGGGSNVLFTKDFNGLIIHPNVKGIETEDENNTAIWLKVNCGEVWDEFVAYCNEKKYGGIENLSLIPGNVGAVPIQNIGAYGAEVKNIITKVNVFDLEEGKTKIFSNSDCQFGYRESFFKKEKKTKYVVLSVTFKLSKKPVLNLSYAKVADEMKRFGDKDIRNLRKAIIAIRKSKLPDIEKIGNAGSFFKNPIVPVQKVLEIQRDYPEVPIYQYNKENMKVAAGWLIEKCGWKGFSEGETGVYHKQALVIINKGRASGKAILKFSEKIKKSVLKNFNIQLEPEVLIL